MRRTWDVYLMDGAKNNETSIIGKQERTCFRENTPGNEPSLTFCAISLSVKSDIHIT